MKKIKSYILLIVLLAFGVTSRAQVGSYRNDFAVGFNGGYQLNSINFLPTVPQNMLGGLNFGFTGRYTCEKYFNTICAVQIEINYAQLGWDERIWDINEKPCILNATGEEAHYTRNLGYVQMPLLAHLGWGREESGLKFYLNMGPQFGYLLKESTKTNFTVKNDLSSDLPYYSNVTPQRVNNTIAQDTMAVQTKFDYGITAGLGVELSMKRAGHLLLEARYYYGLGNLYHDSKSDYFATSHPNSIVFKATYLFDIVRTKNAKRK